MPIGGSTKPFAGKVRIKYENFVFICWCKSELHYTLYKARSPEKRPFRSRFIRPKVQVTKSTARAARRDPRLGADQRSKSRCLGASQVTRQASKLQQPWQLLTVPTCLNLLSDTRSVQRNKKSFKFFYLQKVLDYLLRKLVK